MTPTLLAAELTPKAVELLKQSTAEILANSTGFLEHIAIKHAIPIIEQNMPILLRDAITLVFDHFGSQTLYEIIKSIPAPGTKSRA